MQVDDEAERGRLSTWTVATLSPRLMLRSASGRLDLSLYLQAEGARGMLTLLAGTPSPTVAGWLRYAALKSGRRGHDSAGDKPLDCMAID
jgi:hypothetical protein